MEQGVMEEGVSATASHRESCPQCGRTIQHCICRFIRPITPRTKLLILQHPQEPDKLLGSAMLLHRAVAGSVLRIGLSWRNLEHALGSVVADPKRWIVIYLGSSKAVSVNGDPLVLVDKAGSALNPPPALRNFEGVVVLDGTWSQAKTLWWRNAWLLKLQRAVILPQTPSLYGELRREPRHEALSSIEAAGVTLAAIDGDQKIYQLLRDSFQEMITAFGGEARAIHHARPRRRRSRRRR